MIPGNINHARALSNVHSNCAPRASDGDSIGSLAAAAVVLLLFAFAPLGPLPLAGAALASMLTSATWGLPLGTPSPWIMGFGPGVGTRRACFVEGWQTAVLALAVFASGGRRHGPTFPAKAGPLVAGGAGILDDAFIVSSR